jgi:regulatory protein
MTSKTKIHAINLLSRRDHSTQELKIKLQQKGHELNDIQPALAELAAAGYLNESRYTENYIHWRSQKGYGPERIALELSSKGIADTMIADLLDFTDNAWLIKATEVKKKHFKNDTVTDFKAKAKQMRFLQYRGFTHEQIKYVMSETDENDPY